MRILQLIGMFFLVSATPAMAGGAATAWTVSQKSGDVLVFHPGMQAASVQVSASLQPGDVIATGTNGRAMLIRGGDYVVVAPGSRLLLPKDTEQSGFTRLVQQVGTMLYKVHHTGLPHFAVQTPMLAAVVKGTSFTVIVDQDRAAVQVTEGIVEVSPAVGQARRLVEKGMTVYVGREKPDTIIDLRRGMLEMPHAANSETVRVIGTPDAPLSTITALTGGLVHAVTAPAVVIASGQPVSGAVTSTLGNRPQPVQATSGAAASLVPASSGQATVVQASASATTAPAVQGVQTIAPNSTQPAAQSTGTAATQTVTTVVQTVAPAAAPPVVNAVQTTVAAVTQPVVNTVQTAVPAVTQPVVNTVQTAVPAVTQPVVNVVQTAVPAVTQPVVNTVQTSVPAVTQPVVNTVQTAVPAVTQPVVNAVQTTAPAVTQPAANVVQTTVPAAQPVTTVVQTTVPATVQPVPSGVPTAAPAVTPPAVASVTTAAPVVTAPATNVITTLIKP